MIANVKYTFIDQYSGINLDEEMSSDGCTTMPDWVEFNDNHKRKCKMIIDNISMIDGIIISVEHIFAHPESGCAWIYASLYEDKNSHIKIDICCYDSIGLIIDGESRITDRSNIPF